MYFLLLFFIKNINNKSVYIAQNLVRSAIPGAYTLFPDGAGRPGHNRQLPIFNGFAKHFQINTYLLNIFIQHSLHSLRH